MNDTIELLVRTLCDLRPMNPTNGAYLYCQTRSNQQSIFKAAQSLLNNSLTYKILILNTKAKSGYPGFTEWKQQLEQLGIPEKKIEGVIINKTTMLNTLIESEGIIRFAKQHSYFIVCRCATISAIEGFHDRSNGSAQGISRVIDL